MKRIITFTIVLISLSSICHSQTPKSTVLNVLKKMAQQCNLELSYSPDLVNLTDSTDFVFSTNSDSCFIQIEEQAKVKISVTNNHIIVKPANNKTIQLQGKVIDTKTKEPLPHAHLLIKTAGTGTISNRDGNFSFKIHGKFAGEEITFSFLGYEHTTALIPFNNADSLVVKMQQKPYTLSDVYVLPNGNAPVEIVKRAVKNIKRNYHRKTIQMEAFYRNTSFNNNGKALQLIEAALLIEDKGIANNATSTKIDLQEIRKSSNYLIPQPKKYEILEKFWGHRNVIHRCYNKNMVRYYREEWWFKPLLEYNDFKYEFEGFVWLDSIKVYKFKYIWNAMLPDGKRVTEHKNHGDTGGYFFISIKDFGILKIERKSWPHEDSLAKKLEFNHKGIKQSEISYQKINGKYYLKYISGATSPNGSFVEFEDNNVATKDLKVKTRQWAEEVLLVTRIRTDRKKFDKIKYREKLKKDENSYKKNYPYNADFWRDYNILQKNPVEEKYISDMEWEKSLDIQFEENSRNNAKN